MITAMSPPLQDAVCFSRWLVFPGWTQISSRHSIPQGKCVGDSSFFFFPNLNQKILWCLCFWLLSLLLRLLPFVMFCLFAGCFVKFMIGGVENSGTVILTWGRFEKVGWKIQNKHSSDPHCQKGKGINVWKCHVWRLISCIYSGAPYLHTFKRSW